MEKESSVFLIFLHSVRVPHVTISDRGHSDDGPPERVRYGLEEGHFGARLSEIDSRREQDHS